MDEEQFRVRGKEMVDYICTYMQTISKRRVAPLVEPGYLRSEIPPEAPVDPEPWEDVMDDVEKKIMPGITHWQHPQFHAYFPAGNSYPTIIADMLSSGLGIVGFSWAASPACTELEIVMLDWMGKALGLPPAFLSGSETCSKGGGAIEGSASDCVLVCMLVARATAIKRLKTIYPKEDEGVLLSKLVGYCSKEAHSCVEKGAMLSFFKLRVLPTDDNGSLRGDTLQQAMKKDQDNGLVPFYVAATLGTTGTCAFDDLDEIGNVVRHFPSVWFHVDCAYAGSAFICPEFRHHLKGIKHVDSINTNPNKMMLTAFDCSLLWVKDKITFTKALTVNPIYLKFDGQPIDYRHWGTPLSRRFRSLKLWFLLRNYGISGIQKYIRNHCELAKYFEQLVRKDARFIVCNQVELGLVCLRLVGGPNDTIDQVNSLTQSLLLAINASGALHMVPTLFNGYFLIRFCVTAQHATKQEMDKAWDVISKIAEVVLLTESSKMGANHPIEDYMHSYLVRAVSDTRMYHPAITMASESATAMKAAIAATTGEVSSSKPDLNPTSWIIHPHHAFFNDLHDLPHRISGWFKEHEKLEPSRPDPSHEEPAPHQ